jgi:hypothetical protein
MRTPEQIAADRLRPGQRKRTGAPFSSTETARTLSGGAGTAPADLFVSWTGSTPTVTKVFRFGMTGGRGFSEGGLA